MSGPGHSVRARDRQLAFQSLAAGWTDCPGGVPIGRVLPGSEGCLFYHDDQSAICRAPERLVGVRAARADASLLLSETSRRRIPLLREARIPPSFRKLRC